MTTPTSPPTGPGLDLTQLRKLRERPRNHQQLVDRITDHLEEHDGYLAFSGGKDSTVIAHLARQADPAVPVVWFDSGLEYPETRTFIENLATDWDLNLHVIQARPTALEILVASGAWDHHAPNAVTVSLDQALIEAPARLAHATFGPGEIWGVRSAEASGRRHRYATSLRRETRERCHGCCPTSSNPTREQRARHGGVIRRADTTVAYGPIWDWKTPQVWEYLHGRTLPVNPVYERLQQLGAPEHAQRVSHVIDGDHLQRGRVTWLRRGWPQLYAELLEHFPDWRSTPDRRAISGSAYVPQEPQEPTRRRSCRRQPDRGRCPRLALAEPCRLDPPVRPRHRSGPWGDGGTVTCITPRHHVLSRPGGNTVAATHNGSAATTRAPAGQPA